MKPLNRQFREIKIPANTIFLPDREIKDSRNVPRKFSRIVSPAKIKNNKVVVGASRFADKCAMNKATDKVRGRTSPPA